MVHGGGVCEPEGEWGKEPRLGVPSFVSKRAVVAHNCFIPRSEELYTAVLCLLSEYNNHWVNRLWFTTCDGCHDTTSPEKKKAYFGRRGLFRVPSISFLLSPIRNKILLRGGRKDKGEGTTSHTNMDEELKKPDKVLKALQALKPLFTRTAMDFTAGPCVQIQILQVLEYF